MECQRTDKWLNGPGPNVCGCMSEAGSQWAGVSHLLVTFANHSKKQTYYSLSRGGAADGFHNRINMIRCVFQEENYLPPWAQS